MTHTITNANIFYRLNKLKQSLGVEILKTFLYESKSKKSHFNLKTTQLITVGFVAIILIGTLLLSLPISIKDGQTTDFLTALFTATSATCVTGLVLVDTYTHWTLFGQTVILVLIQIGGLGFMTVATLFSLILRRKISLKERIVMAESISQYSVQGVVHLTKRILFCTLLFEGIGAILLSFEFVPIFGFKTGLYYGVFHSVTAFCNAGFDIMGRYGEFSSLTPFVDSTYVNIVIMVLVIVGGLGFAVIQDIITKKKFRNFHLHTKLVLLITGILLLGGFIFFFLMEYNNPSTLGNMSLQSKINAAMFQSVTTRTAGFNTIDQASLTNSSLLLSMFLMIIGGCPGSTAGGIKTTTFGIIVFSVISAIKGRNDTELFKKRVPHALVIRAFVLGIFSVIVVAIATMLITTFNHVSLTQAIFEASSAFGTVGLTLSVTPTLGFVGRITLIVTMFFGRVGVLTTLLAIGNKSSANHQDYRYAKDTVSLG